MAHIRHSLHPVAASSVEVFPSRRSTCTPRVGYYTAVAVVVRTAHIYMVQARSDEVGGACMGRGVLVLG